ncbi:MAG: hypothetical protein ACRDDF_00405 [Aeromonas sp.]
MAKMTFKFTTSFDATVIVDMELAREQLADLRKAQAAEGFNKLPVKNQVFTKLVLQAAERSEEEGIAELLRYNMRTGMNEQLAADFAHVSDELTIRPSPAKVVCHGLEVKA